MASVSEGNDRPVKGTQVRKNDTVKQTIVANIEAPRLRGVSTKHFTQFYRLRQLYEKQIEEKNKEPGTSVNAVSYRASIDDADLKIFVAAKWIDVDDISKITEDQLKECVKSRSVKTLDGSQLWLVDKAVQHVRMDMSLSEAEDRVWSFHSYYLQVLENAGYANLPSEKPHISIAHILKRLQPAKLYSRMKDIIEWRKVEQFDRKDFNTFMREVASQAVKLEQEQLLAVHDNKHEHRKEKVGKSSKRNDAKSDGKGTHKADYSRTGMNDNKKRSRELPPCLNPKCSEKHFISDCKVTSEEEKEKLRMEYRKNKKVKTGRSIQRLGAEEIDNHSALFSATLLNGAVECLVLTDQGSDTNLISSSVFEAMKKAGFKGKVTILVPPHKYQGVSKENVITCRRKITADLNLRIRHGTSLLIRNITWRVSDEESDNVIIGRPLLEAIGFDNQQILEAACDNHDGIIDAAELNQESKPSERVASLLTEAIFHSAGGYENDGLEEDDVYIDLGEDPDEDIVAEIQKRVDEAKSNGLSPDGVKKLRTLLFDNKAVFRIRLGKSEPALVSPMKIDLDPRKKPVKSKVRRYPPRQRKFLNKYIETLVEYGYWIPNPNATWQAAPHLVPKNSKAEFRTTIDTRPVNSATLKKAWPMPHIESEMEDFKGSVCFAIIDFVSAYWQLALHPDSYDACGIVCPNGVYSATRVLPGLTNSAAHFQSQVEPLFAELRPNMKSWIEDFTLHSKNEEELLDLIKRFLEICKEKRLLVSIRKSNFFTKQVKWCGRVIDKDGYSMKPANIESFRDIVKPLMADELCQFVHCCRWMSKSIPDFSRRIGPLNDLLEKAYTMKGKRKKRAIKGLSLAQVGWNPEHDLIFNEMKMAITNAIRLTYPNDGNVICIYTDASNRYWSGVVTQCEKKELDKPTHEQKHEPMAFLSSEFTRTEKNWSTFEKEGFAIFKTFSTLD